MNVGGCRKPCECLGAKPFKFQWQHGIPKIYGRPVWLAGMTVGLAHINGPITDRMEAEAVAAVLESGMMTSPARNGGPAVRRLERAVREFTGARHAVAVSSGTAALHAALISMDIGHGDEVIIPSFSYVATANAVVAAGATPVFADTSGNHTMDAASVSAAITPRTRCIMPVHLYGRAARTDEILDAASGRGIHIIEDAAQSLGTTVQGRHTGTIADAGCYSLYPGKVATAGEGGVVVTDNDATYERLLSVRNHGNNGGAFDTFGLNLRMPEMCAAVGAVQMGKLPAFLERRRRNARMLTETLRDSGVGLPPVREGENPNWSLYTITAVNRDQISAHLKRNGVGAAVYYPTPIHVMPHYNTGLSLPDTEEAARTVLSVPVHPRVEPADLETIASMIKKCA